MHEKDEHDNNDCYWTSPKVVINNGGGGGGPGNSACYCSNSNATEICENFDEYSTGMIGTQSSCWTTWNNRAGSSEDAPVKNAGGNKYLDLEGSYLGVGAKNVIMKLGNRKSGKYELKFKINVTNGKNGYYALLHEHSTGGGKKAHSVIFGHNGLGYLQVGSQRTGFNYSQGTWVTVRQIIDLDADQTTLTVGGTTVKTWTFAQPTSFTDVADKLGIGALNFYPTAWDYDFKIDDITLKPVPGGNFVDNTIPEAADEAIPVSADFADQENLTPTPKVEKAVVVTELTAYPNPTRGLFTVQAGLEQVDDVQIELRNLQGAILETRTLDQVEQFRMDFDLTNQSPGVYLINVITKQRVETRRIVLQ